MMDSVPAGSEDVLSDAVPAASWAVPIALPPLRKVTVPVGVVAPLACLTMATKVMGEFWLMLDADEESAVLVLMAVAEGALTVITTMLELDALKVTAPE